jgi:hypothetical protein
VKFNPRYFNLIHNMLPKDLLITLPNHSPHSNLLFLLCPPKEISGSGSWWLTPEILATQEAENRRTAVQNSPGK